MLLGGCQTSQVNHDFDASRDFGAYRNWAWKDPALQYRPDDPRIKSDLTEQRIRQAVGEQLDQRGLRPAAAGTKADLNVQAYLIVEDRQQQVTTNYGGAWGGPWNGYWGGPMYNETRNITYKVATIQIDLLDGKDGKLVWRGSDEQMMGSTPNPQDRNNAIRTTVTHILSSYPAALTMQSRPTPESGTALQLSVAIVPTICSISPAPLSTTIRRWNRRRWPCNVTSLGRRTGFLNSTSISILAAGRCSAECGQCARLVPQPVGDGLGEAEQLGGQGAQVDRVVVAGDPRIAAADIGGGLPAGQFADLAGVGWASSRRFAFEFHASAQHAALGFPQQAEGIFDAWSPRQRSRPWRGACRFCACTPMNSSLTPPNGPVDADAIAQVDQPQQREGKCLGR